MMRPEAIAIAAALLLLVLSVASVILGDHFEIRWLFKVGGTILFTMAVTVVAVIITGLLGYGLGWWQ